jgi:hypothetical protein
MYAPDQPRNSGHVNDPTLTAMLKEQRRTRDLAARKQILFDMQRYVAAQQYYVYTNANMITGCDPQKFHFQSELVLPIHEKTRWVPHSLLWGGKRAARRAATISVWPTKQAPMPFMTCSITLSGHPSTARLCSSGRLRRLCRTSFTR